MDKINETAAKHFAQEFAIHLKDFDIKADT